MFMEILFSLFSKRKFPCDDSEECQCGAVVNTCFFFSSLCLSGFPQGALVSSHNPKT